MGKGEKITVQNGVLTVPDYPIIPFIIGDGTGPDIWRAASRVLDAAVEKAYQGKRPFSGKKCWQEKKPSTKPANSSAQAGFSWH